MDVIKWTSGIDWILRQNYHFMMMVMMMMTAVQWSQKGLIDWLIEMEWNVEMILFMEEENWRKPLEQGSE